MLETLKQVVIILQQISELLAQLKEIADSGGIDLPLKLNGNNIVLPPSPTV